jgi:hypothetical protein
VEDFGAYISPKSARQIYPNALKGLISISSRLCGVPRGERGLRLGNFSGEFCELTVAHSQSLTTLALKSDISEADIVPVRRTTTLEREVESMVSG